MIGRKGLQLARPGLWGCPYHGLVSGSPPSIALPGGLAVDYPGTLSGRRAGDTLLVHVPGTPEVMRSEEELEADAANGWQWWSKAILSGGDMKLHGQPLNGWVYTDSEGSRWIVRGLNGVGILGNSISATIQLHRLGNIPGDAESYSYGVTLADIGQSAPALNHLAGLNLRLQDIKSDGSAALFAVEATRSPKAGGLWPSNSESRWQPAVGWLELTLTGFGSAAVATLSVVHTRAQTIGTYLQTGAGAQAYVFSTLYVMRAQTSDIDWIDTPFLTTGSVPPEAEWRVDAGTGRPWNGTVLTSRTGVIVACWYGDSLRTLTCDYEYTYSGDYPEPTWGGPTGTDVYSNAQWVSRFTLSGSAAWNRYERRSVKLKLDGALVDEISHDETKSGTNTCVRSTEFDRWLSWDGQPADGTGGGWPQGPGLYSPIEYTDAEFLTLDRIGGGLDTSNFGGWLCCPYRLSNRMWSLLVGEFPGSSTYIWTWRTAASDVAQPDGLSSTVSWAWSLTPPPLPVLFGSACPITGDMARSLNTPLTWT